MTNKTKLVLYWSKKENEWLLKNRPSDVEIHFVGGNPKIEKTDKLYGVYALEGDVWNELDVAVTHTNYQESMFPYDDKDNWYYIKCECSWKSFKKYRSEVLEDHRDHLIEVLKND